MRPKTIRLTAGVIGAASLVVAGLWVPRAKEAQQGTAHDIRCVKGRSDVYTMEYSARSRIGRSVGMIRGTGGEMRFVFGGEVISTCITADNAQVGRRIVITLSKAETAGVSLPGVEVSTVIGLFETVDLATGRHSLIFDEGVATGARHVARDLLAKTQFNGGRGKSWEVAEADVQGFYTARYRVTQEDGAKAVEVTKEPIRYTPSKGTLVDVKPDSRVTFSLDDRESRITKVNAKIGTVTRSGKSVLSESDTEITLTWTGRKPASAAPQADRAIQELARLAQDSRNRDDFAASGAEAALERALHKRELGGLGWNDLKRRLDSAVEAEETALFLKFRALFTLHPEEARKTVPEVGAGKVEDGRFRLLALALAKAGNEPSQMALLESLEEQAGNVREEAYLLGLVGLAKNPGLALERHLRKKFETAEDRDVRQAARLAIGNLSAAVRGTRPQSYAANLEAEVARLKTAKGHEAVVDSLHALTNYGGDQVYQAAAPRLTDEDPTIRATAVSALRFVDGELAENAILRALTEDQDAEVRRSAASELTFRKLSATAIEVVRMMVKKTAEEETLAALLTVLRNHADARPELRGDLEYVKNNNPAESVRLHAEALLTTL